MAATVSAWSKPGAWALDSEEHEEELLQQRQDETVKGGATSNGTGGDVLNDFPSLAAAAATKTKKKKGQTLSLQEFATYGSAKPAQSASAANKGLTSEDLLMLPTGPRQRSAEELDRSRLGGGFRSYGSYDRAARGSSDEPRRQGGFGRDSSREVAPSRADEIDDWGANKKSPVGNGLERRERGERGGFFSDSLSRADEVDNWAANKSFVPSEGRRYERKGSFESNGSADSDNWGKKKEEEGRRYGSRGSAFDSLRERRGSQESLNGPDSENWGRKREEVTNGSSASGGRPRLNLQPRTLPLESQQNGPESAAKSKGSNPFGEARPREEVLKEKGQDWKEIDQKLESVKIKEAAIGSSYGKRSFGSNGRSSLPEDKSARSWRKPESVDARPSSAEDTSENTDNGSVKEAEEKDPEV